MITVVCPLYNAEKEILRLNKSLLAQKNVELEIKYILTKSRDKTKKILDKNNICYTEITKEEFSHSLTREKAAMSANGEVIVFLTQDVVISDEHFIEKLIRPIINGEVEATYARQVTKYNNIEKYTREHNYPVESFVTSKADLKEKGLKTFFFSDAAGAVDAKTFKKLGGYDGKDLPISEDMYFAYKLIMNGGKIKYVAEAVVYHSHKFTVKELYNRYKATGEFMKMNPQIAKYGVNAAGGGMAKYILKAALKEGNWKVIVRYIPDMAARFVGMKVGKR
ncbi:glycosyltransferase [Candidatus Saccharibacteria bacterium]|nr:glycosyltransferase [Candidatus Saccharibacteria bacterium]